MGNVNIVFDKRKLAAYQIAYDYCKNKGLSDEFMQELWDGMLIDPVLHDEYVYYLEHGELSGTAKCEGYTMFDLYFYHLREFNLNHDLGKNTAACSKDEICIHAFHTMGMLRREPEKYKKMLEKSLGMDSF